MFCDIKGNEPLLSGFTHDRKTRTQPLQRVLDLLPTHTGNIRRSSPPMHILSDSMQRCSSTGSAQDPDTRSSHSSSTRVKRAERRDAEHRDAERRDAELKVSFEETVRVRRWSVCSVEISAETMHSLTSAPSVVVGGQPIFLNPNADVKRIRPLLQSTAPPDNYMRIQEPSPALRRQPRSLHLPSTASPEAATVRHSESLARQRITGSFTRSSTVLRTPFSSLALASFIDLSDSLSPPEGSPQARALRVQPDQGAPAPLMRHASDTLLVQPIRSGSRSFSDRSSRSVTGQSRMRPFVRSARFGNHPGGNPGANRWFL